MEQDPQQPQRPKSDSGTPFKEMTSMQKTMFVCKVIVCAITFGIVFPNVMSD